MRLLLLLMIASLSITACGQKGPLYKTPEPELNQSHPVESTKVMEIHQQ